MGLKKRDCRRQRGADPITIRSASISLALAVIASPIARDRTVSLSIVTPRDGTDVASSRDVLVSVAGLDDVDGVKVEVLLDGTPVPDVGQPNRNAGVPGRQTSGR